MKRRTLFTPRQLEVLRLRNRGFTQENVARMFGTSRENVTIIERNAYKAIKVAKSTIEAFDSLNADGIFVIPARTSIYDIPRVIFLRGDVLGVKIANDAHGIFTMVKSKGKIRNHHLVSPIAVDIKPDGRLIIR